VKLGHTRPAKLCLESFASWRGGIEYDNAYLIGTGGEAFLVVGKQAEFQFIKLNQAATLESTEEEEISADDLDFDLM